MRWSCKTNLFARISLCGLVSLLLLTALPLSAAELSVQYEVIARSGETPVPGGVGNFTGFGSPPAIDDEGNVVFLSGGPEEVGIYTHINGVCCQRVVNNHTLIPGGGGAKFSGFNLEDTYDVDGGRVAFQLTNGYLTVYSNVGQASPTDLVEVAAIDGGEWSVGGNPWVDGDNVAMWGRRLIPSDHYTTQIWDGTDLSESFIDPGAGYVFGGTQASISGDAAIFARYNPTSGSAELVVSDGSYYEPLLVLDSTPVPGMNNVVFTTFYAYPQIDLNGQDAAFLGFGGNKQVLVKRVNGGALQNVVDTTTVLPGSGGEVAGSILDDGYSLADGQVVFHANGQYWLEGLYTDIGGELSVLVDNQSNNTIELDGVAEQITYFYVSPNSLAKTPQGYMVVFKADLQSGGSAIIRATIPDGPGGPDPDSFTVYKDFSPNSSASVSVSLSCTSGTVTNNPQWASEASPAVFEIENATPNTTCTALESVPSGYSANQSGCQDGDPLNGSCTIVNTLVQSPDYFWVLIDFSDDNPMSVSVTLTCTSGTVTNNPLHPSEGSPAKFNIIGAESGTTCTASENPVPAGYTKDESTCQNNDPLGGACLIENILIPGSDDTFTVNKDFTDNNSASVSVSLSCTDGTVTNKPQLASESSPAVFNITGAGSSTTCTASESVPSGYTANQSNCQNRAINSSCTIVNVLTPSAQEEEVIYEGFEDGNANGWSTNGSVTVNGQNAIGQYSLRHRNSSSSERSLSTVGYNNVSVEIQLAANSLENGDDCYAEVSTNGGGQWITVAEVNNGSDNGNFISGTKNPVGASNNSNLRLRIRSTGSQNNDYCYGDEVRVLGTPDVGNIGTFVVFKDFSDNSSASVSVSLNCSSGTVSNNPQLASEASPAVFSISGAGSGATCTASESVPAGYMANQSNCQNRAINGSCTIVNTVITSSDSFTVNKDFSDNSSTWVNMHLSCSSGTVTNSPQQAREGTAAVFNISGAGSGATCTASESAPAGYTANQSNCQNRAINSSCTIVNTLDPPQEEVVIEYDFEDGSSGDWSLDGNVAIDGILAIGQYSLRHGKDATSILSFSTAGYEDVSITMHLAATSLKKNDGCFAEFSTDGGGSWAPVIEIDNGNDSGNFVSGTVSPSGADDNLDVRLRFGLTGKSGVGYCYGDEVIVSGTPN